MSQVNSEIVRLVYETVSRHGAEAGAEFADVSVDVVDRTEGDDRPSSGRGALAEVYGRAGQVFDDVRLEPTELIDAGDAVVACVRIGGRTLGTGAESWIRAYHVHWLRKGRTVRLEVCGDRTAALRAAVASGPRETANPASSSPVSPPPPPAGDRPIVPGS